MRARTDRLANKRVAVRGLRAEKRRGFYGVVVKAPVPLVLYSMRCMTQRIEVSTPERFSA